MAAPSVLGGRSVIVDELNLLREHGFPRGVSSESEVDRLGENGVSFRTLQSFRGGFDQVVTPLVRVLRFAAHQITVASDSFKLIAPVVADLFGAEVTRDARHERAVIRIPEIGKWLTD